MVNFKKRLGKNLAKGTEIAKRQSTTLTKILVPELVYFKSNVAEVDEPEGFEGAEEAGQGTNPTVKWNRVGETIYGEYLGDRSIELEKNKTQKLYDIDLDPALAKILGTESIAVWGGSQLDEKIPKLDPKWGDRILIQFVGTATTKRGQNPVNLFKVKIVRKAS